MKRLLIVEDEPFIQDLYTRAFTQSGYQVDNALDGEQAIKLVKTTTYDMVLLDIMLPKANGIKVLQTIRSTPSSFQKVPVFMITNLGREDVKQEALHAGADGYLMKTDFTPQALVAEINRFFGQIESPVPPSATVAV